MSLDLVSERPVNRDLFGDKRPETDSCQPGARRRVGDMWSNLFECFREL